MSDWNDVITVLNHDPAIRSWTPLPGTTHAAQATITTPEHGEIAMILDNGTNKHWLQLLITVSDSTAARVWEAAGRSLQDTPAIGLAQYGESIVIRHGILLPHATPTRSPTASPSPSPPRQPSSTPPPTTNPFRPGPGPHKGETLTHRYEHTSEKAQRWKGKPSHRYEHTPQRGRGKPSPE
jgi:hypothetical protein